MQLDLGQKIRELRRRDGRTQEALAEAIGVTSQAVSRWEANGGYPDMETIPAIANYFGVTIDELFGYENNRDKKIDSLVKQIRGMNSRNNGVDINIDECLALARQAMIEFPTNERIMLSLAEVLYNAGYVRYGEYHLIDAEGYNVYDIERHREYSEWKEAIVIYEKLLKTLEVGEMRHNALEHLTQLYLNMGEHERALAAIESAPTIYGSYEYLRTNAFDGKRRAEACGEALLKLICASSETMIRTMLSYEQNMTPCEKAQSIRSAITLFDLVCTDGNYGIYNSYIARMYTLLSLYLWLNGKHDEAFDALDKSLLHFKAFEALCIKDEAAYTAPLLKLVKIDMDQWRFDKTHPHTEAISLAEDWPWWSVQEYSLVKDEIQADPRWNEWVSKLQQ
ncbi:MAG: helix-turn-helix transcriptional regulator [Clostridia bacterium]|nr:helix-turn-helix transcriptional regulator [Clostridia bacterium]